MANRKGNGAPTNKTVGALGDIYTDLNTGAEYKCIFSYRSDNDEAFDCQWKLVKEGKASQKPVNKAPEKPEEKEKKAPEPTPAPKPNPQQNQSKHTDYTAYSKKTN